MRIYFVERGISFFEGHLVEQFRAPAINVAGQSALRRRLDTSLSTLVGAKEGGLAQVALCVEERQPMLKVVERVLVELGSHHPGDNRLRLLERNTASLRGIDQVLAHVGGVGPVEAKDIRFIVPGNVTGEDPRDDVSRVRVSRLLRRLGVGPLHEPRGASGQGLRGRAHEPAPAAIHGRGARRGVPRRGGGDLGADL